MNKLLMIAFYYPPVGGSSGVLRTLKFSKYLPEFYWQPAVLTVRNNVYETKDESLLREVPSDIEVLRTRAIDTKKHLSFKGRYLDMCAVPDNYIGWLPFAIPRGLHFIKRKKIKALYSTSPIATAHLIALCLKKLTHLPWVADFRDPWVEVALNLAGTGIRFRLESWLEEKVMVNADRIIATTNLLQQELMRRYPQIPANKFHVVMNGFDEEDFLTQVPTLHHASSNKLELIHAGLLNDSYRSPVPLLQALNTLIQSNKIPREAIRVRFFGGGAYLQSVQFKQTVVALGLDSVVEIPGLVPYEECLQQLAQSHLLILIQGGMDTNTLIPAKAFEYLRLGKPILSLTPEEGATAELIKNFSAGFVVNPQDQNELQRILLECYIKFTKKALHVVINQEKLRKYTRKELTRQLAEILNTVS